MAKRNKKSAKKQPVKNISPKGATKKVVAKEHDGKMLSYILLGIIALLVLFIRSHYFDLPFERDEGDYSYLGQLVLDGKTPYLDFYEQKPPGLFYTYAFIMAICGSTVKGLHIGFALINLGSIVFMFLLVRDWLDDWVAGIAAAAGVGILSMTPHLMGFAVQSEHLLAFGTIAGLWGMVRGFKTGHWAWFVFAGVELAWTSMIKQNGVFFVALGGLLVIGHFYFKNKKFDKEFWRGVGAYSLGVAGTLLFVALLMMIQGAFSEFMFWIYEYPKEAYISSIPADVSRNLFNTTLNNALDGYSFWWLLGLIGMIGIWFTKLPNIVKLSGVLFFILGFLSIVPGYRFYGHYWLHFVPAIAFCVGLFFYTAKHFLKERLNPNMLNYGLLGVLVVGVLYNVSQQSDWYFNDDKETYLRTIYGGNPFPEMKEVGDFLNQKKQDGDQLVVLGSEPQLHIYTGMRSPSKHNYMAFLVSPHPKHKEWQQELIKDVETTRPRFVVYVNHGISWATYPNTDASIFNWFGTYQQENLRLIGVADKLPDGRVNYVWDNAVNTYQPQGTSYVGVFEHK